MNTSLTLTPVGAVPTAALDGNALMEKLRAKATNAVRDAFLDSLSPDEYNAFITQAVDEFINGPFSKRFTMKTERELIHSKDDYDRIAKIATIQEEWREPKTGAYSYGEMHYTITRTVPIAGYDPTQDPGTLPGMIRQLIREQVNKDMLTEIMASPEMKQKFVPDGGPFSSGYHVFEGFVTKFLQDNMSMILQKEREAMISNVIQMTLNNLRNGGRGY